MVKRCVIAIVVTGEVGRRYAFLKRNVSVKPVELTIAQYVSTSLTSISASMLRELLNVS